MVTTTEDHSKSISLDYFPDKTFNYISLFSCSLTNHKPTYFLGSKSRVAVPVEIPVDLPNSAKIYRNPLEIYRNLKKTNLLLMTSPVYYVKNKKNDIIKKSDMAQVLDSCITTT